jgi:hypothetical protein
MTKIEVGKRYKFLLPEGQLFTLGTKYKGFNVRVIHSSYTSVRKILRVDNDHVPVLFVAEVESIEFQNRVVGIILSKIVQLDS